jgi:hypothetical protein
VDLDELFGIIAIDEATEWRGRVGLPSLFSPTGKYIKSWGGVRFLKGTPGMTANRIRSLKESNPDAPGSVTFSDGDSFVLRPRVPFAFSSLQPRL